MCLMYFTVFLNKDYDDYDYDDDDDEPHNNLGRTSGGGGGKLFNVNFHGLKEGEGEERNALFLSFIE